MTYMQYIPHSGRKKKQCLSTTQQ